MAKYSIGGETFTGHTFDEAYDKYNKSRGERGEPGSSGRSGPPGSELGDDTGPQVTPDPETPDPVTPGPVTPSDIKTSGTINVGDVIQTSRGGVTHTIEVTDVNRKTGFVTGNIIDSTYPGDIGLLKGFTATTLEDMGFTPLGTGVPVPQNPVYDPLGPEQGPSGSIITDAAQKILDRFRRGIYTEDDTREFLSGMGYGSLDIDQFLDNERARLTEEQLLSRNRQGRLDLYGGITAQDGYVNPFIEYIQSRNFDPLSNMYSMAVGLGDIDTDTETFLDFLPDSLTSDIDAREYERLLGRVSNFMKGEGSDNPDTQAYIESLMLDPSRQFDFLYENVNRNVPQAFSNASQNILRNNFYRAYWLDRINSAMGAFAPSAFQQFYNQGVGFGGPSDVEFRNALGLTGDLLSSPLSTKRGVSDFNNFEIDLREQLLNSPEDQFRLAQLARIPDIPVYFRDNFFDRSRRFFDAYQADRRANPEMVPFLSYMADRGYQFY